MKSMPEEMNNHNLMIVAIVAIVAVVAIVLMITKSGSKNAPVEELFITEDVKIVNMAGQTFSIPFGAEVRCSNGYCFFDYGTRTYAIKSDDGVASHIDYLPTIQPSLR